jgi:hypothetical protein
MKQTRDKEYLRLVISALVHRFGLGPVLRVLEALEPRKVRGARNSPSRAPRPGKRSLAGLTAEQRRLLVPFRQSLAERELLPSSEDLRRFAELAGLKELRGKDRRTLLSRLLAHLATLSPRFLEELLPRAATISERERREGYSVLTEKLVRGP